MDPLSSRVGGQSERKRFVPMNGEICLVRKLFVSLILEH